MKFTRRSHRHAEVSAGALTDIMFFLMLFFLIASTMSTPSIIKLFLPKSSSRQSISSPTTVVSISQDMRYYIDDVPVDAADLIPKLQEKVKDKKEAVIMLRAERGVPVEYVVDVFEIGKQSPHVKIFIATQKKE